MMRVTTAVVLWAIAMSADAQQTIPEPPAKAIVEDYARYLIGPLPDSLPYDRTFYKQYVDAQGIPIISSAKVPDAALLLARDIVVYMLAGRPDLRKEMIAKGYRVGVMAQTEMTTDIPEQRDRKKPSRDDPRLTRGERENCAAHRDARPRYGRSGGEYHQHGQYPWAPHRRHRDGAKPVCAARRAGQYGRRHVLSRRGQQGIRAQSCVPPRATKRRWAVRPGSVADLTASDAELRLAAGVDRTDFERQ